MADLSIGATRGITIRQPWAGLVAAGIKRTENRVRVSPWRSAVGERLVIHAGLTEDLSAWDLPQVREHASSAPTTIRGAALGTAVLLGVHPGRDLNRESGCRCAVEWRQDDQWHLIFGDHQLLIEPVPMRGALGLWPVARPLTEGSAC